MIVSTELFVELESSIQGWYLEDYQKIFDEITQQEMFAYRKVILFDKKSFVIMGQGVWLRSETREGVEVAVISEDEVKHMITWLEVTT